MVHETGKQCSWTVNCKVFAGKLSAQNASLIVFVGSYEEIDIRCLFCEVSMYLMTIIFVPSPPFHSVIWAVTSTLKDSTTINTVKRSLCFYLSISWCGHTGEVSPSRRQYCLFFSLHTIMTNYCRVLVALTLWLPLHRVPKQLPSTTQWPLRQLDLNYIKLKCFSQERHWQPSPRKPNLLQQVQVREEPPQASPNPSFFTVTNSSTSNPVFSTWTSSRLIQHQALVLAHLARQLRHFFVPQVPIVFVRQYLPRLSDVLLILPRAVELPTAVENCCRVFWLTLPNH